MPRVLGVATGGTVFLLALYADLLVVGLVGKATQSGVFGICGPYGSDVALWAMLGMVVVGLLGSGWLAFRTGRAVSRRRT